MTRLLIDCDTGIDDTLAILTAVFDDNTELVGVGAVWGNIDVRQAARNSDYVLQLAGADEVPVALGAAGPLNGDDAVFAAHVHGADGLGGAAVLDHRPALSGETAVQQMIRLSHEFAGELEIAAIGPLTNLAEALSVDPSIVERIRRVTVMGGAALVPGNITAAAEANIWHDPEAAALVFDASWPVTMVGLDVTMRTAITEDHHRRLSEGGPVGRYCASILGHYFDFYTGVRGRRAAANHDALAVGIAIGQVEVMQSATVPVVIDTTVGPDRGRTVADLRGMWADRWDVDGARHTVVLATEPGFDDRMIERLASA